MTTAPTVTLPTTGSDPRKIQKVSAEAAINAALSNLFNQLAAGVTGLDPKGNWDASAGTFPTNADAITANGNAFYVVSVAGTVDSQAFAVGDWLVALVDAPSTSTYAANWFRADYSNIIPPGLPKKYYATYAAFLADTDLGYSGTTTIVAADDYVHILEGDTSMKVLSSGSSGDVQNAASTPVQFKVAASSTITPAMFGADPLGVSECTTEFQAYLDYCWQNGISADWAGLYSVNAVEYGDPAATTGETETASFSGRCILQAAGALDVLFTCHQTYFAELGSLRLIGTGSDTWTTRTCEVAFELKTSGRTFVPDLRIENFSYAGIVSNSLISGNDNVASFGPTWIKNCGSGSGPGRLSNALSSTYTLQAAPNDFVGGSLSSSQYSVLDVGTDLPDYVLDETYGAITDTAVLVWIGGNPYTVVAADAVAGTINVFPWIKNEATSGTLYYSFGGGAHVVGSDSNNIQFTIIDALNCRSAFNSCSPYGIIVSGCVTGQFCDIYCIFGAKPSATHAGGTVMHLYCELNTASYLEVVSNGPFGTGTRFATVLSGNEGTLSKIKVIGLAVDASGNTSAAQRTISNLRVYHRGRMLETIGLAAGSVSGLTLKPWIPQYQIYANSATVAFNIENFEDVNRITGANSTILTCHGSGGAGHSTGTITFDCPTDWYIELDGTLGAINTDATVSGLAAVAQFNILWRTDSDVLQIAQIK